MELALERPLVNQAPPVNSVLNRTHCYEPLYPSTETSVQGERFMTDVASLWAKSLAAYPLALICTLCSSFFISRACPHYPFVALTHESEQQIVAPVSSFSSKIILTLFSSISHI